MTAPRRIVTMTPNPSVDRTLDVQALHRGEVVRAHAVRTDAGGKGVNVSRALAANGHETCAVLPVGGPDGQLLTATLTTEGIEHRTVAVAAATRTNVAITEPDGTTTKVNAPGAPLDLADVDALLHEATADLEGVAWLVGCGSLPVGAPDDLYAHLVERGHRAGVPVAVDATGTPLLAAVDAGADLVKPNREELEEAVGRPLPTLADVVAGARELHERGARTVLVSLGAEGAVLVGAEPPTRATAPPVHPRSTVGAGDTLLAGYLAALTADGRDDPAVHPLAVAVAWGTAAVALPGTAVPGPDHIRADRVATAPVPAPDPSSSPAA